MLGYALGEYIPFVYMQDAYIALYKTKTTGTLPIVQQCLGNYEPKFNDYLMYYNSHCFCFRMFMGVKGLLHKHFKRLELYKMKYNCTIKIGCKTERSV